MRSCANDNSKILDDDDAQDRKDEARRLSVEKEARQWRGCPDLIGRAQEAALACRRATDEISHLSRMKREAPGRRGPLTEAINHQLCTFKSAAWQLDVFTAAMDPGEAQCFDAWLSEIDRGRDR